VLGALTTPGLTVPAFATVPAVGDTVISGAATPNSFVFIWQDNPSFPEHGPESLPSIELGRAQVNSLGLFNVSLSTAFTGEMVSVGVSLTNQFIPDAGELAVQVNPVPELSTLLLLTAGLTGIISYHHWRRRTVWLSWVDNEPKSLH
jgi:hypothetical protein